MPRKVEHLACEGNGIGQATTEHYLATSTDDSLAAVARWKTAFAGTNVGTAKSQFMGSVGVEEMESRLVIGQHKIPFTVTFSCVTLALSTLSSELGVKFVHTLRYLATRSVETIGVSGLKIVEEFW